MWQKIKEPLNVTKVQLHMLLVLQNVKMESWNVWKKKKEPLNMTKVLLDVMLILSNETMEPSNVRKNKWTTECDKNIITCNIGTT